VAAPSDEARISVLQRQLVRSPHDPHLQAKLACELQAQQYYPEAVSAYLNAARGFERIDALSPAVAALGAVLVMEPHHQYAQKEFARVSALSAFAGADDAGEGPVTNTLTAEVSWGQGMMPLATADLQEVEDDGFADEPTHAVRLAGSTPITVLSTADLSFVEVLESDDDDAVNKRLGNPDDFCLLVEDDAESWEGTAPELTSSAKIESLPCFASPSLPLRLLERAEVEGVSPGQRVFSTGDPAADLFQVIDGKVELCWPSPTGSEPFAIIEPGTFFGELGLLTSGQCALDAQVKVAGELARVDQAQVRAQAQRDSTFDRTLRKVYRDRLMTLCRRSSPLLRALSDADVRQLFTVGRPLVVARGGVIVEGGVRPKGILLVLLGQVAALTAGGQREQLIGVGQCACQRALFQGDHCSHALRAEGFVQLLVVPGSWLVNAPEAKIVRYALQQQPDAAG